MPFRLSRQLFYILAGGCMCTWICITYLVVKNGTKSKRTDGDLYTLHGFDIYDDFEVTDEPMQDSGNWSKNWDRNGFNRPDGMAHEENEEDDDNEYQGEENDSNEEGETVEEEEEEENDDVEGQGQEKIPVNDEIVKEDENEENDEDEYEDNNNENDEEDKYHKNEDEKDDSGNIDKNVVAQEEKDAVLKWQQQHDKNNLDFQKMNNVKVEGEELDNDAQDNENKNNLHVQNEQKGRVEDDGDKEMTEKVENVKEEEEMDDREDDDVEDVEEDEVDRAAKYRDFDDKNAHEHVLDDGENDNDEDEDEVGDDNEHDNNEDHDDNEDIFRNFDVRIPKKAAINDNRMEEDIANDNDKEDIIKNIRNLPQLDAQKNMKELKKDENNYDHGDQPFAKLKEFEENGDNLQTRDEHVFAFKDKETMKQGGNQPVQRVKDIEMDRLNPKKEVNDHNLVKDLDKTFKTKEKADHMIIDNKKGHKGNITVKGVNQGKIVENAEIKINLSRKGENGTGIKLDYEKMPAKERQKMEQLYRVHGFNAYISDMISVNRTLPDIRIDKCKQIVYDVNPATTNLPQTSVIIVFHNEALSVLLRSIYSVLNRSPDYLLKEIILVDDFSTLAEDKTLQSVISQIGKAHLVRTTKHEGLIRARLIGAKLATAPVLTFLDAHIECFQGWLEPLLARLVEKPDTVICPQLQTVSGSSFQINIQDQIYVGTFLLSDLVFDWLPVQYMDKHLQTSDTGTVRTPVFAGGHFAIYKSYFYHIGSYDAEMNLWGAENLELSFRVWMCGGTVEIHPCSHVAHVYRQTNPLEITMKKEIDSASIRNNLRTASVWMDGYMKFYKEKGMENVDVGNITDRVELRKRLKCKSFQWYIDNVHPGLYVPGQALLIGEIWNSAFNVCIDSGISVLSAHVSATKCRNRTSQFWHLSKLNALQREAGCVEYPKNTADDPRPTLERCNGGGPSQHWVYTEKGWLYNPQSHLCLGLTTEEKTLQILKCETNERFQWEWRNTGSENS